MVYGIRSIALLYWDCMGTSRALGRKVKLQELDKQQNKGHNRCSR